ncbi:hypothetical protein [Adonisia turfae]|uniref:hypothetical protein n=1 Tax=Adonisia turfae TaxID=2950184 RepID=UPI0013D27D1F|nr:hypothetical protein [Adonisia turfae]
MSIAKDNLNDIRNPIGQRHGAWPFSWEQWLMPASIKQFRQMVGTKLKFKNVDKTVHAFKTFFNRHADVVDMLPNILERGGPNGQELFLSMVEQLTTPELLAIVKDFALSQSGTDLID